MSTWILLRGLSREARHWGDFPALFMREIPGSRVVALDLPGNGRFQAMSSPASIDRMVSHCRAELARQPMPPPYCLLALSMGAMVATCWAQRHPAEIDRTVLVNTSFGNFHSPLRRLRIRAWPLLLRIALAREAQRKEALIFSITSRQPAMPSLLLQDWLDIRRSNPVSVANTVKQLIAAARFRAPAACAPTPTLLLGSEGDQLVDAHCTRDIARRWNCPAALHPHAGHDLPLDDALWVAARIRDWLAARATRPKL